MREANFTDREWQQHGDYWLLVGKTSMPAAILIPIAPIKEETKPNERRATETLRFTGS